MEVIRIEHPVDGLGVFISGRGSFLPIWDDIIRRHTLANGFPGYFYDEELKNNVDAADAWFLHYNFAYKSLDQLKNGFKMHELRMLIEQAGFKVYTLEVTDFFQSQYQVVFRKSSIIHKRDISFMFL